MILLTILAGVLFIVGNVGIAYIGNKYEYPDHVAHMNVFTAMFVTGSGMLIIILTGAL